MKNSIFNSTSHVFRDRHSNSSTELEIKNSQEYVSSSVSKYLFALKQTSSRINHSPSFSSYYKFSNHLKEDLLSSLIPPTKSPLSLNTGSNHLPSTSPSNFTKEILGSKKTLDSPSSKIIFKKTLGSYEKTSSSCLDASSCIKSKVKSVKHITSSF